MDLISIACDRCGAPLRVPSHSNFVTCRHCQTQLAIRHNDNSAWTEQLDRIDRQTRKISKQVALLRQKTQQERLNREQPRTTPRPRKAEPDVPAGEEPTVRFLRLASILFGGFVLTMVTGSLLPFLLAMLAFFVMSFLKAVEWRQHQQSRLALLLRSKSLDWPDRQAAHNPAIALFGAVHPMEEQELFAMASEVEHATPDQAPPPVEQPGAYFTAESSAFDAGSGSVGVPDNDVTSGSFSFGTSTPDVGASFPDMPSSGPSFDVSMPSTDFSGSASFDSSSSGM